jgi:hypothetical protein
MPAQNAVRILRTTAKETPVANGVSDRPQGDGGGPFLNTQSKGNESACELDGTAGRLNKVGGRERPVSCSGLEDQVRFRHAGEVRSELNREN